MVDFLLVFHPSQNGRTQHQQVSRQLQATAAECVELFPSQVPRTPTFAAACGISDSAEQSIHSWKSPRLLCGTRAERLPRVHVLQKTLVNRLQAMGTASMCRVSLCTPGLQTSAAPWQPAASCPGLCAPSTLRFRARDAPLRCHETPPHTPQQNNLPATM